MRAAFALLAFLIGARLGFIFRSFSRERIEALDTLTRDISTLLDMLRLRPSTLAALCSALKSPVFHEFASALPSSKNADEAWRRALTKAANERGEVKALMHSLGESVFAVGEALALLDSRAQQGALELALSLIEKDGALYRNENARRAKLSPTLGVLLGLGAALIII